MRCLLTVLLVCLIPVSVFATDEEEDDEPTYRMLRITAENDTLMLNDEGKLVDPEPYVLEPISVWGQLDAGPKDCFVVTEDLFVAYDVESMSWKRCERGGEWEPMEEPVLSVLVGSHLMIGDFISSDTAHTVQAVVEDLEQVEEWEAIAQNGSSGRLTFDPVTAKEPKIAFHVDPVLPTVGRADPLEYVVKATIGELEAESVPFEQNALHRLRQEYVDLEQNTVPAASEFHTSAAAYVNLTDTSDTHDYHEDWKVIDLVNEKARAFVATATDSGIAVEFISGYRCPVRNRVIKNNPKKGSESQHIYGRAFDFEADIETPDTTHTRLNYELWEILYYTRPAPGYLR